MGREKGLVRDFLNDSSFRVSESSYSRLKFASESEWAGDEDEEALNEKD